MIRGLPDRCQAKNRRQIVAIVGCAESTKEPRNHELRVEDSISDFTLHQQWSNKGGWKTTLNNLRLIIQPTILFWMIIPWLDIRLVAK